MINNNMKKKTIACLFLLILCMCAGNAYSQNLSLIRGKWIEATKPAIKLYALTENSNLEEIGSSTINKDGTFAFAFYPSQEGFYALGIWPQSSVNRYVFYFKPGDELNFVIEGDDWKLVGANTPENKEVDRWHRLIQPLEAKSIYFMNTASNFKDFFPQFEQLLPAIQKFTPSKTRNATFNRAFENYKKFNLIDIALTFLMTPRTMHPQKNDFIAYYRELSIPELTRSTAILSYPNGLTLIYKAYNLWLINTCDNKEILKQKSDQIDSELLGSKVQISDDTVRGELVVALAERCSNYDSFMDFKNKYEQYLYNDSQKQRFKFLLSKLDNHTKGHPAIDFKFTDVNGKEVALSDFKGKVVYIDVWATWCGPCRQEIPHLLKLEEEFHNEKDLIFMSVSVDSPKDLDKWKAMLKENNMKGVQLFAGSKSNDILGVYKISGIPRFILVGKDGKLIDAKAPRPSSSEIRPLLKSALGNN